MSFKVDENLPVEVAEILREGGYDAVSVLDQELGGAEDPDIASRRSSRLSQVRKPLDDVVRWERW